MSDLDAASGCRRSILGIGRVAVSWVMPGAPLMTIVGGKVVHSAL